MRKIQEKELGLIQDFWFRYPEDTTDSHLMTLFKRSISGDVDGLLEKEIVVTCTDVEIKEGKWPLSTSHYGVMLEVRGCNVPVYVYAKSTNNIYLPDGYFLAVNKTNYEENAHADEITETGLNLLISLSSFYLKRAPEKWPFVDSREQL